MYVCAQYVLNHSTRMCTHAHTYIRNGMIIIHMEKLQILKYVHCIFFNRERNVYMERARAEEIATRRRPPPKQEIDMVCVCTYLCM